MLRPLGQFQQFFRRDLGGVRLGREQAQQVQAGKGFHLALERAGPDREQSHLVARLGAHVLFHVPQQPFLGSLQNPVRGHGRGNRHQRQQRQHDQRGAPFAARALS